jgi:hypothetical protein
MAKFTAQRHRLDALEAALGGRGTRIVITGGLPEGTTVQPAPNPQPKDTQPQPAQPGSKLDGTAA